MQRHHSLIIHVLTTIHNFTTIDSFIVPSFHTNNKLVPLHQCRHYNSNAFPAAAASDCNDSKSWHYVPYNGFDSVVTNNDCNDILYNYCCDAVVSILDVQNNALNEYRWIHSIQRDDTTPSLQDESTAHNNNKYNDVSSIDHPIQQSQPNPPIAALNSINATHRWASHFVRPLQLCPWAASSLDTLGAIRYWVLLIDDYTHDNSDVRNENVVLHHMEQMVREAGVQLEQITQPNSENMKPIDPSAAISFVICAPYNSSCGDDIEVEFEPFHEFFIDLEDRLLDECDDYWDGIDTTRNNDDSVENNESDIPQGCKITIAAFHPHWRFNTQGGANDMKESAVDYEKRTPYPTISIVMSSAIDSLMQNDDYNNEEAEESGSSVVTNRIAALNEQTLCALGVDKLKEMVNNYVLCCPKSNATSADTI